MRNFGGKGKELTDMVNGEQVDTRPLRAFIIKSIISLIIYISATMWGGAISAMNGRLTSCRFGLLEALLPSGPS